MNYSDRKSLIPEIILLTLFIGVGHNLFIKFALYYAIPKLDMLMHFLGGLLIGLIILKVFFSGKRFNFAHLHKVFITLIVLLGVLFIGGFWEVFEYGVGLTPIYNLTTFDTASDLVFDLAGAFAAVWWYFKKVWHVG